MEIDRIWSTELSPRPQHPLMSRLATRRLLCTAVYYYGRYGWNGTRDMAGNERGGVPLLPYSCDCYRYYRYGDGHHEPQHHHQRRRLPVITATTNKFHPTVSIAPKATIIVSTLSCRWYRFVSPTAYRIQTSGNSKIGLFLTIISYLRILALSTVTDQ